MTFSAHGLFNLLTIVAHGSRTVQLIPPPDCRVTKGNLDHFLLPTSHPRIVLQYSILRPRAKFLNSILRPPNSTLIMYEVKT